MAGMLESWEAGRLGGWEAIQDFKTFEYFSR